jgi:hypothetical protein
MEVVYSEDQLTVMNDCAECLREEARCEACQDEFNNKQINSAYELVDEGNQQYPRAWLRSADEPSGHDWVAPIVRLSDGRVREELLEPVVHMEDRTFSPTLEVLSDERVCTGCFLVCLTAAKCPNCEGE